MTTTGGRQLHVFVSKEDGEEQFSAVAANLPGCVGCGDTVEDALESVTESAAALLETYVAGKQVVPWRDSYAVPIGNNAQQFWVDVPAPMRGVTNRPD